MLAIYMLGIYMLGIYMLGIYILASSSNAQAIYMLGSLGEQIDFSILRFLNEDNH